MLATSIIVSVSAAEAVRALGTAYKDVIRARQLSGATQQLEASASLEVSVKAIDQQERRELARDPRTAAIARAMPLRLIAPVSRAESAGAAEAWGIAAVGAAASPFDGSGVKVAVLDTGIDQQHPAFRGLALGPDNVVDFTGEGDRDVDGHGTHCAATIFGRDVQGTRIGVAPGVSDVLIGKVLGQRASNSSMLFSAMDWAIQQGANVVSMSLGFDFPAMVQALQNAGWPADLAVSTALSTYRGNLEVFNALMGKAEALSRAGIAIAGTSGTLVIAATGNESRAGHNPDYRIAASLPAAAAGVYSVGALERVEDGKLRLADFSNGGAVVSAPGVEILSAQAGGDLVPMSGTSMATPHVAGVAALWWQKLKNSGSRNMPMTVSARLLASATRENIADSSPGDYGEGLVQAPV